MFLQFSSIWPPTRALSGHHLSLPPCLSLPQCDRIGCFFTARKPSKTPHSGHSGLRDPPWGPALAVRALPVKACIRRAGTPPPRRRCSHVGCTNGPEGGTGGGEGQGANWLMAREGHLKSWHFTQRNSQRRNRKVTVWAQLCPTGWRGLENGIKTSLSLSEVASAPLASEVFQGRRLRDSERSAACAGSELDWRRRRRQKSDVWPPPLKCIHSSDGRGRERERPGIERWKERSRTWFSKKYAAAPMIRGWSATLDEGCRGTSLSRLP